MKLSFQLYPWKICTLGEGNWKIKHLTEDPFSEWTRLFAEKDFHFLFAFIWGNVIYTEVYSDIFDILSLMFYLENFINKGTSSCRLFFRGEPEIEKILIPFSGGILFNQANLECLSVSLGIIRVIRNDSFTLFNRRFYVLCLCVCICVNINLFTAPSLKEKNKLKIVWCCVTIPQNMVRGINTKQINSQTDSSLNYFEIQSVC